MSKKSIQNYQATEADDEKFLDYRSIAPLAAYIDRIGAEQLGFRKFIVKERHGKYYLERALILLNVDPDKKKENRLVLDGTITCKGEAYEPTNEERKAIGEALAGKEIPTSTPAKKKSSEGLRNELGAKDEHWFEIIDRSIPGDANIVMVQRRVEPAGGGKYYEPWTHYPDGKWRRMEPARDLPFWKPHRPLGSRQIMVHEGPKAARHIDWLLNDPSKEAKKEREAHPWAKELARYEHWGQIGGALAPHRTDYNDLHDANPDEVVYVCDNDKPGNSVLQEFSKHYRRKLRGLRFDGSWPYGFDLADPMPEKFFTTDTKGRRYWNGDRLEDLLQAATYATEQIIVKQAIGRPRIVTKLLKDFAEEWVHSEKPDYYIHELKPNELLSKDQFNDRVAPYSHVKDTAELLKKIDGNKVTQPDYDPSKPPGIIRDKDGRRVNTHVGTKIVEEEGDLTPWHEFMEHLYPHEGDRHEMYRWSYTLIGKPGTKMKYGVLLVSETQGVGKNTFGRILEYLIGEENVSYPSEAEIVDSQFNSWAARKRLAIMSEIYAGDSLKAYNRLKDKITDMTIEVHEKFQNPYKTKNCIHTLALSNSPRAMKIDMEDRRILMPEVAENKLPPGYWMQFNHWLFKENGLGKILFAARKWAETTNEPIIESDEAPWTSRKRAFIEDQMSDGQTLVMEFLDFVAEEMVRERNPEELKDEEIILTNEKQATRGSPRTKVIGRDVIIFDTDLRALILEQIWDSQKTEKLETPFTIRKIAKGRPNQRWHINKNRKFRLASWGSADRKQGLIVSSQELMNKTAGELSEMGLKPLDVVAIYRRWRKL